ncbi:hypothetical protein N5923_22310 [Erwiniaceae bacterium BAC15a-03b]|uniref:Uncharacterized protein n=1 Tax=Winslowiella arboricola TaxID=2978220 RepID=A0A9J6Q1U5_9GAMM|nr:hypothetical protein [Winslowiella arboricola]MCU5775372.1 hypothetical protein [Winslowiella arboricola]MCU5780231.1 hypothetical protein [Winslowiella arboricola]
MRYSRVKPDFSYLTALSGEVLKTTRVDKGASMALNNINGRPHLAISASGVVRSWQYDSYCCHCASNF